MKTETIRRKYGLLRGRFQPFHNGHLHTCLEILKLHEVLVVGIVVVKKNVTADELAVWAERAAKHSIVDSFKSEKNPFSYNEVYEMIQGALLEQGIPPCRIRLVPHFPPTVYSGDLESIFFPTQTEAVLYIPQRGDHNIAGVKIYADRGWTVVPMNLLKPDLSASFLRELLKQGRDIKEYVPRFVADWITISLLHKRNF